MLPRSIKTKNQIRCLRSQIDKSIICLKQKYNLTSSTISKPKTGDQIIIIKSCHGFPNNGYCLFVGIQATSDVM